MRSWIKGLSAAVFLLPGLAFAQCVSLTSVYNQSFDTLSNTAGSTTNILGITGWFVTETGGGARDNEQYAVDTGASTTGDTYSYGAAAATDRALGSLRSGTLIPVFGSCYTNNTGSTLTSFDIAYTGEQWRLGTITRTDQLNFEYSTNATDLVTGTWTGVAALNFVTPDTAIVGAKNGNAAATRTAKSATIGSLNIASGTTFWIRWIDADATSADDGLAIDDFTLTPATVSVLPNLSINDVTMAEGNAGTSAFTFTVSLSAPAGAGGVTFDIATANNTATTANNDYVAKSLTSQTIPAGNTTYTFDVTVNGDTTAEPNETFFVNITNITGANANDAQGLGTITNEDFNITPIHDIQGNGGSSPLVGSVVSTRGTVTGLRTNGFFLQEPDATVDADPNTSEGIFVFTSSAPTVALGDNIIVSGTISEFIPTSSPGQLPLTELTTVTVNSVLSTGNPLPNSIPLTSADANAASPLQSLEKYEGMRVTASLTVVAPAAGNINEANATSTGNGVFYGVMPGVNRPFREKGISVLDPYPTPVGVDVWDSNPERIRVQSTGLGGVAMNASVGDTLANISGVLDYGFGAYTLVPYSGQTYTVAAMPTAVSNAAEDEFTVAGFNLLRFFDSVNDPNSDPVLTATALNNRLGKTANAICEFVKTPDILGVVEVEKLAVLQSLADTINNGVVTGGSPVVATCNTAPNYVPYLFEGNDVGGIDVGFMVSTKEVAPGVPRVEVVSVTQENAGELFVNPDNSTDLLNDRPTLRLEAIVHHANGSSYPVTVYINHLRSLSGVNDTTAGSNGWATDGARIRAKRLKQAESLAALIQARQTANPDEKIMLLGDFNAFEVNDGYVDSMGIITGQETAVGTVVNHSGFVVTTPLTNMTTVSAAADKYSFSFDGNAQSLDHAVVNQALMMDAGIRSEHARINSDFAEILFGTYTQTTPGFYDVPVRVSDHDPVVLYVKPKAFTDVDLSVAASNPDTNVNAGNSTTFTVVANNLDEGKAVDNAVVSLVLDFAINGVNVTAPAGWTCAAPVVAAASTTIECTTANFAALASASFNVLVPVPPEFEDGDLTLSATISADQSDTASENNIASDFVTVIGQEADLAIRTRGASTIYVGYKTRINTVADNYGPDAARNVAVAITTNGPKSAFKITSVPADWSCSLDAAYATARFLCSLNSGLTMARGTRPEFVLTFTAPASMGSSNLIVGVGISASTADPNAGNNENSYSLRVERLRGISPPQVPND